MNVLSNRLVQNTFDNLEDSGCIKVEDNAVQSLLLGSIASQYYLSYKTISMFGSNIGANTSLDVSFSILYKIKGQTLVASNLHEKS